MNSIAGVILLLVALSSGEFVNKTEDEFLRASDRCFKQLKVPESYAAGFQNFQYPDEPIVHRYLRCIWLDMELWDDRNGFNVEHIADLYKDKANTEVLIPILSECNRNTQKDPALQWLYRGFKCILDSRVGTWFKEDVTKHASKSR